MRMNTLDLKAYFNSQPHEEADQVTLMRLGRITHFNSQPHEEADSSGEISPPIPFISTHSLTKRLTHLWKEATAGKYISTHSLTKRLTTLMMDFFFSHSHFNSQPHEEADLVGFCFLKADFISTHSLTKRLTAKHKHIYAITSISTHSLTKRLTSLCLR